MMLEQFEEPARRVLELAEQAAQRYGDGCIGSQHLVLGLGEIDQSPLLPFFEERGLSFDSYRERVGREASHGAVPAEMTFAPDAQEMIEAALQCAREFGDRLISTEHLVAALARRLSGTGAQLLAALGFDLQRMSVRMESEARARAALHKPDVSSLRRTYARSELDEQHVLADPLRELQTWLAQALDAKLLEPHAMCVSTVAADGQPSSRMVLLRALDERGLVFYTSYLSRKGIQIQHCAKAAALFYWAELERQVRVEGSVEQVSEQESDAYFASRPSGHKLSAWASEQSEPLSSRTLLAQRVEDYASRFEGDEIPRPHSWGGYLIRPVRIEFWQGRENRLHDRLEFTKAGVSWNVQRLSP